MTSGCSESFTCDWNTHCLLSITMNASTINHLPQLKVIEWKDSVKPGQKCKSLLRNPLQLLCGKKEYQNCQKCWWTFLKIKIIADVKTKNGNSNFVPSWFFIFLMYQTYLKDDSTYTEKIFFKSTSYNL